MTDPKFKYQHHDIHMDDINEYDIQKIRGDSINKFVDSRETDPVRLTIDCFMRYLTSKGYRIKKDEPES